MKIFKSKWMMAFLAILSMALCFSGGYATAKLTGNSNDSSQLDSDSDSNSSNTNSNSSITNG